MGRPLLASPLALFLAALFLAACGSSSSSPSRQVVTASRPVGSWQGTGNKTIGDVPSDTGRFRISWEAKNERSSGNGIFRLTVRSAVSGRPLQVVVDHRGEGHGRADFQDGPRIYDFLVDSTGIEWSFSVEEIFEAYAKELPK
jgi:hypothetical protein